MIGLPYGWRTTNIEGMKIEIPKLLNLGGGLLNITPKAEVKSAEIFTETHPLGTKIDAEHAGAIIFKPKSSKT